MNWKRGLLRVWAAASLLWVALWTVLNWSGVAASLSDLSCLVSGGSSGPWCKYRLIGAIAADGLEDRHFWIGLIAPLIAALLLGYTLLWVGRGFRAKT
jgi:glycerol uptake facilitator-like aquaporin